MAFSWDSRFVMSGDGEGKLFIWDWKSTKVGPLDGVQTGPVSAAWLLSALAVTGGQQHGLCMPPTLHKSPAPALPQIVRSMKCHDSVLIDCQWHPLETSKVATCSWANGDIKLWVRGRRAAEGGWPEWARRSAVRGSLHHALPAAPMVDALTVPSFPSLRRIERCQCAAWRPSQRCRPAFTKRLPQPCLVALSLLFLQLIPVLLCFAAATSVCDTCCSKFQLFFSRSDGHTL